MQADHAALATAASKQQTTAAAAVKAKRARQDDDVHQGPMPPPSRRIPNAATATARSGATKRSDSTGSDWSLYDQVVAGGQRMSQATPFRLPRSSHRAAQEPQQRLSATKPNPSHFGDGSGGGAPSSWSNGGRNSANLSSAATGSQRQPLPTPSPQPRRPTLVQVTNIPPPATAAKLDASSPRLLTTQRTFGKPVVPSKRKLPKELLADDGDDVFENIFGPF
jgi:hypothetical protein